MKSSNRISRRTSLCAIIIATLSLFIPSHPFAQELSSATTAIENDLVNLLPTVADDAQDFTDEEYGVFEALLDFPTDESAIFYLERIDALNIAKERLYARWYRQRAARLVVQIDEAIVSAMNLFDAALYRERKEVDERFQLLMAQRDFSGLHKLICEQEALQSRSKRRDVYYNPYIVQLYEAYYSLRIREAFQAEDAAALNEILDELIKTDSPCVALCAFNLIDLITLYDRRQAQKFRADIVSAYGSSKTKGIAYAVSITRPSRLFTPLPNVVKNADRLFVVPDNRDLDFYRRLYLEISTAEPPKTPQPSNAKRSSLSSSEAQTPQAERDKRRAALAQGVFYEQKSIALAKTLRHIVLLSHDSGVDPDELEAYKSIVFSKRNYQSARELVELGLVDLEKDPYDRAQWNNIASLRARDLLQEASLADEARRREIVRECAELAKYSVGVFDEFEALAKHVDDSRADFFGELYETLRQVGQESNVPEILARAARLTEGDLSRRITTLVGKKLELTGIDLNEQPFDLKEFAGKITVLFVASTPDSLLEALERPELSGLIERRAKGEIELVAYLYSPRIGKVLHQKSVSTRKDVIALDELKGKSWRTLAEDLAERSNLTLNTKFTLLSKEYNVSVFPFCFLIDQDGEVLGVYGDDRLPSYARMNQYIDNLTTQPDKRE